MSHAISIPAVAAKLAISASEFDWKSAQSGLPLNALEAFSAASGLALKDLFGIVIPARTLKNRYLRGEPLNIDESDRLARVARVFELALKVWNNREDTREWLLTPKHRFEEKTPLAMLRTELGERAVEEFLIQIDEGYFA
jgi:putative toxin-antitoxin system antitoxin component (TIGR02293 family)